MSIIDYYFRVVMWWQGDLLVVRRFGRKITINLSLYFFVGFVNTVTGSVKVVVTSSNLDKENKDHCNILKEICKP